jgi:prepilin-type N-terminal cleavage/methylation domain-containing protein
MRKKNGFTVMEMMVGSAVLLIVIGITMSFFRYQSKFGGELRKDMSNKETIGLAMMVLKRDLIQAGCGLYDNRALGLWVDGYANNFYHKLYVNYGYYLQMSPKGSDSMYNQAYFIAGSTTNPLTLNRTRRYDVGSALTYNKATSVWTSVAVSGVPVENADGSATFSFASLSPGTTFVPAISYRLIDPDTNDDTPPYPDAAYPELQRNGQRIAGGKKEPFMKFTDFSIRCRFVNSFSGVPAGIDALNWSPNNADDFATRKFDDLKMVEITIRYKTITPGMDPSVASNWKQQISKVFTVSPRNVLMMANYK